MCQPRNLPESPGEPQSESRKRKAPAGSGNRSRVLSLEELQENFHLPINDVALKLGVCVTVLKQQCRELGIVRWPYRKVRKLDNMLAALENAGPTKARPFALSNGEDERQRKITSVKRTLEELMHDPNSSAHLKLGKVKGAASAAAASKGVGPSASGVEESEDVGAHDDECTGTLKPSSSSSREGDESSILEAAKALVLAFKAGHPGSSDSGEAPTASGVCKAEEEAPKVGSFLHLIESAAKQGGTTSSTPSLVAAPGSVGNSDLEANPLRRAAEGFAPFISSSSSHSAGSKLLMKVEGESLSPISSRGDFDGKAVSLVEVGGRGHGGPLSPPDKESVHGGKPKDSAVELDLISQLGGGGRRAKELAQP